VSTPAAAAPEAQAVAAPVAAMPAMTPSVMAAAPAPAMTPSVMAAAPAPPAPVAPPPAPVVAPAASAASESPASHVPAELVIATARAALQLLIAHHRGGGALPQDVIDLSVQIALSAQLSRR
jgi:hypothetical protein